MDTTIFSAPEADINEPFLLKQLWNLCSDYFYLRCEEINGEEVEKILFCEQN